MNLVDIRNAPVACCWLSGARYDVPLDDTTDAKWRLLAELGVPMYVVGFSRTRTPRRWWQHAHFLLAPDLRTRVLRQASYVLLAVAAVVWLTLFRGVNVLVAQSAAEGVLATALRSFLRIFGRRIAVVVESHGELAIPTHFYAPSAPAAGLSRLRGILTACAMRRASALRAISSSTEEELRRIAPGIPVVRFIGWTDVSVFQSTKRLVPVQDSQTLIYAGVLVPGKQVHTLIEAFAGVAGNFPAASLIIVGAHQSPEYARHLHEQAEALGLGDRVSFPGPLPQRQLAGLMARSRALVLPSISEGLGRVILEAMLCGAVPIGSRTGGIRDLIQDRETGYLFTPGDVRELSECLRAVLEDSNVAEMAARAQAYARGFFSAADYLEGYRRLLQHALAAR